MARSVILFCLFKSSLRLLSDLIFEVTSASRGTSDCADLPIYHIDFLQGLLFYLFALNSSDQYLFVCKLTAVCAAVEFENLGCDVSFGFAAPQSRSSSRRQSAHARKDRRCRGLPFVCFWSVLYHSRVSRQQTTQRSCEFLKSFKCLQFIFAFAASSKAAGCP